MSSSASLTDPKAYHILAYGTLLGSTIFQTFIGGPVAFKALPRPSFSTLQTAVFPIFFTMQSALPAVLALTWPGEKVLETAGTLAVRRHAGALGLLEKENLWSGLVPVAVMFASGFLNLTLFGPMTTKVMKQRKHQGTSNVTHRHKSACRNAQRSRG